MLALTSIAVIPFGPEVEIFGVRTNMELTDLNIGILAILALSSMGVYGIALGGWASNSKYSLLGSLRSSAQMVSYELPMALAIVAPLLMVNTLSFREMVNAQEGFYFGFIPKWNVFAMPFPQVFSFLLFLIAAFAETNRVPFDLPEAETELVSGFHTEYSSLSFAAFFMAEYANIITVCCVGTLIYLGGWHPLWPSDLGSDWVPVVVHLAAAACSSSTAARLCLPAAGIAGPSRPSGSSCWASVSSSRFRCSSPSSSRSSGSPPKSSPSSSSSSGSAALLPRFRYDQLMSFAWTFMFPAAVINLLITGLLVALTTK